MNHDRRGRLTIDLGDGWKLYTNTIPDGAQALGVISQGGEVGALVKLSSGKYVQINAGVVRVLDRRKVAAAIGIKAGRPTEMQGAKRVNVYLDPSSIGIAEKLGKGNVSEGIRQALLQVKEGIALC